jgi:hypothetical protein|tara:strand:+ start:130 stop:393 length:264 start_codon:yes stop_codon:yes gene_type:complete
MHLTHTSLSCIVKNINQLTEGLKMKQLINVLNKINKQLEISNKIASSKLVIDFKNSGFKSNSKKEIETQIPIITSGIHTIYKNIYDN